LDSHTYSFSKNVSRSDNIASQSYRIVVDKLLYISIWINRKKGKNQIKEGYGMKPAVFPAGFDYL
jgi:hypothetical protein